ncbi:MAG TPA: M20 family metallopeptidase [Chloroflexota bacterium]|nr:M20 family metallopeptidase [Chloroflexota bacterium]
MQVERAIVEVQSAVDDERLLDLAQRLIAIPTENPPGDERVAAEFLADYLADNGWSVDLSDVAPGRPNVMVRIDGRAPGPHLIFDGHLDVVPAGDGWTSDPYVPLIKDGRLYGRGAADMKGGVAAMIAAAEAVLRADVPLFGSLALAIVADEEEGNSGTRHLIASGMRGTWAIVPEPTELLPVIAHKGSANLRVHVRGVAAHASTPEQGVNAVDHAARLIGRLSELGDQLRERRHELLGHPTLTVCGIRGGFNDYTVPAACTLVLNRRVLPSETSESVLLEVQAVLEEQARRDPAFDAVLDPVSFMAAMETDPQSPVVLALRSAVQKVRGVDPGVAGWSATSDGSILRHEGQLPTVIFGPGSIARDAHRPDESVAVDDLTQCARIFAATIAQLLGGAS